MADLLLVSALAVVVRLVGTTRVVTAVLVIVNRSRGVFFVLDSLDLGDGVTDLTVHEGAVGGPQSLAGVPEHSSGNTASHLECHSCLKVKHVFGGAMTCRRYWRSPATHVVHTSHPVAFSQRLCFSPTYRQIDVSQDLDTKKPVVERESLVCRCVQRKRTTFRKWMAARRRGGPRLRYCSFKGSTFGRVRHTLADNHRRHRWVHLLNAWSARKP